MVSTRTSLRRDFDKIEYAIVDGELANEKGDRKSSYLYPASKEEENRRFCVEQIAKSVGDKTVFGRTAYYSTWIGSRWSGVNGTGKTTLLDVLSGRSALMEM